MKKIFVVLLLSVFTGFITSGCSDDEEDLMGNVYGIVTDVTTGEPVKNANVILSPGNISTVTGNDGHYEYKNLEAEQYKIQVMSDGYITNSRQITVTPGNTVSCDMALTQKKEEPEKPKE